MPTVLPADAYEYKIKMGSQGVCNDWALQIVIPDRTPTLEQYMEHVSVLVMSLNKSHPGSGSRANTSTTMKVSAIEIDSKKGGTTATAGTAKDDGLTGDYCGQVGHISHDYPNSDFMKNQLKQALVGKDASKGKSGHQRKDKNQGAAPPGWKESGRLAEDSQASQETESEAESELESLSDPDFGAGKGKRGESLRLYLP